MNHNQLVTLQKARDCYCSSSFDDAFKLYVALFEANPGAWWLGMEAIRCKRGTILRPQSGKIIISSPNYLANAYQHNLYSEHRNFQFEVHSRNQLVIDEKLVEATFSKKLVCHQHWLKEIYWQAVSKEEGIHAIDKHVALLRALKAYGATVCWTLHNLVDHDATSLQEELNDYGLRRMAGVSDFIFIHTHGAGELLSSHCGVDLSHKYCLLEHPLYDYLVRSPQGTLPKEIDQTGLDGKRVLVSVGLIRPYKGIPDLLHAFQRVVQRNSAHNSHLIIAGKLYDPEVRAILDGLEDSIRRHITLVPRRVEEDELASLMRLADVSVTPYKKVLTSGSYYLATTFAKPTIAPRKGMFAEVVTDGETGFLYDGSIEELTTLLSNIVKLSSSELARVGENAQSSCKHLTISEVSKRYFTFLEDKG